MRGEVKRAQWAVCVCLSVAPLLLFLLVFWSFAIGDPALDAVLPESKSPGALFVAYPAEHLRIGVLGYASYVFVHLLLCSGACFYYLQSLRALPAGPAADRRFQVGFAVLFALGVCLAIVVLTVTESVFADLVVVPFRHLSARTGVDDIFSPPAGTAAGFLYLAILLPTIFGTVTVVFASAAFHQVVFLRRGPAAATDAAPVKTAIPVLRVKMTVLSLILVSSVVTARAYFHLFPALLLPEAKAEHQLYAELASTLSMACGLLYTATLVMAFAPGAAVLVARFLLPERGELSDSLQTSFEEFWKSSGFDQLKSILQAVLTLAAPALASPLLEILTA